MRYVAAYMLASLGGKDSPSAADIEKILGSVGIDAESDKIKKVISELKGKALQEVIEAGSKKLATVPSGGGGGGAPAAGGGSASAAPAEAKEEKKAEKEESEESDDDMGFGLFD